MGKLSSIYDKVLILLKTDPIYRDSDQKLVARMWSDELKSQGLNPSNINCYKMLCMYALDKLPAADTITRARRKAQEEHPGLRGKNYYQRQHIETEAVKGDLRTMH